MGYIMCLHRVYFWWFTASFAFVDLIGCLLVFWCLVGYICYLWSVGLVRLVACLPGSVGYLLCVWVGWVAV